METRLSASMKLRVLHLEDDAGDAELLRAMLEEAGIACGVTRVRSQEEYQAALDAGGFDIILSDYTLPSFNGAAALRLAREKRPEVPFIYFSGSIGEETAAEALIAGATDYVLKTNPKRLVPAVRRALREAEQRAQSECMKRQFLQSQKMEAVGRLAGGVAHDFNNLLTAILGNCEFVIQALGPDHPVCKDVQEIKEAGRRAADLTRQLLAFSRKQILDPKVIDLNALVAGMERLLRRLIGEDIESVSLPGKDLGCVKADPGQIEQVIMNLAVNARDAMPDGGRLTIATENAELDGPAPGGGFDAAPGPYVLLSVRDTGGGMDETVLPHLFEPFFTTKGPGKGTGLGLSTIYGIVKQSSGYICAESAPGRGTTFKIWFPRVKDALAPAAARPASSKPSHGTETVLLVEDEEIVRNVARRILERNGYVVLTAFNGEEALLICREYKGPIHIMVTDVVMPQMSGGELAREVGALRPGTRVLYLSGYTDEVVAKKGVLKPGLHFLQKPFLPEALARKVRDALDG